jgi:hypothetical protein
MLPSEMKRVRELEQENARLKKIVADLTLDREMLQDVVLKAQPDVDSGMPEQVARALVLLERAIILDPGYALAHGNAAMCHHCLFLRAGLQEVNRAASLSARLPSRPAISPPSVLC